MSMSGRDVRRIDRNRSKSRWLTIDPAPEPQAATRIPGSRTSVMTWPTVRK
jgi:hypothetical protein